MTTPDQRFRINEVLSTIHRDIRAELKAATFAQSVAYSTHHLHRIFKRVTGESVHEYIRRTRLEAAANQLMFAPELTVRQIAETCGFLSLASFSHAFKSIYHVTPGAWRSSHKRHQHRYFLSDPDINRAYQRMANRDLPTPNIVQLQPCHVAYIRHKGYGRGIANTWQHLRCWALAEQRSIDTQIGLHHSNPALVPLDECHYVACIGINEPIIRRGVVNSVEIPGGLHAAFSLAGQYGELLPYISKMLEQWLPCSGYTTKTTPAFARYHKNQFLEDGDEFELTFYLPITPQWSRA